MSQIFPSTFKILNMHQEPNETLQKIHKNVVNSAYDIISLKGRAFEFDIGA